LVAESPHATMLAMAVDRSVPESATRRIVLLCSRLRDGAPFRSIAGNVLHAVPGDVLAVG
jgi:hypothetical protein